MPKFHLPVINDQILTDVFILNNLNPTPLLVKALFDTGATRSCITTSLSHELQLNPISKSSVNTANGRRDCNVYKLKIGFPFPAPNNKVRIEAPNEIDVVEINDNPIWKIIIGMDIIQQGVLIVDSGNYIFAI